MTEQRVVITKRRLFVGKMVWLFGGGVALVILGTVIQLRMTWSREQMRGITSEAHDAVAAVRTGTEQVTPETNPFEPLLDVIQQLNESPTP